MSCTSTAISNRYIHSRQWSCLTVCCHIWCNFFSSPPCKRSKWYHIWYTRFSCLLYILSLSHFPSFIFISCLLKDHFASKPIDKHTTVHLKPHDLNSSHCFYNVQWKYNTIYNTYVTARVQLRVQSIHLWPLTEANLLLCHYSNTLNLVGMIRTIYLAAPYKHVSSVLVAP